MKRFRMVLAVVIAAIIGLSLFSAPRVLSQTPTPKPTPMPRQITVEDPENPSKNVTVTIQSGLGDSQADVDKVWANLGAAILASPKMKTKVLEGGQKEGHTNSLTVNVHRDNKAVTLGNNSPGYSNIVNIDLGDIPAMRPHLTGQNEADKDKIVADKKEETLAHEITHTSQTSNVPRLENEDMAVATANQILLELGMAYLRESYGYCDYSVNKTFINLIMRGSFLIYIFDVTAFTAGRASEGEDIEELCPGPVGGISKSPDVEALPADTTNQANTDHTGLAWIFGGAAAGVLIVVASGTVWHARRRRLS